MSRNNYFTKHTRLISPMDLLRLSFNRYQRNVTTSTHTSSWTTTTDTSRRSQFTAGLCCLLSTSPPEPYSLGRVLLDRPPTSLSDWLIPVTLLWDGHQCTPVILLKETSWSALPPGSLPEQTVYSSIWLSQPNLVNPHVELTHLPVPQETELCTYHLKVSGHMMSACNVFCSHNNHSPGDPLYIRLLPNLLLATNLLCSQYTIRQILGLERVIINDNFTSLEDVNQYLRKTVAALV